MYQILSPIVMDADLYKTDRIAVSLLRGKMRDIEDRIKLLQAHQKDTCAQIVEIIGKQLLKQYLQNCEPQIGQVIVNHDFGLLYMFDGSDKLKFMDGEEDTNALYCKNQRRNGICPTDWLGS